MQKGQAYPLDSGESAQGRPSLGNYRSNDRNSASASRRDYFLEITDEGLRAVVTEADFDANGNEPGISQGIASTFETVDHVLNKGKDLRR
jgi:hypothetical protein